jgi:hypothetical protein
MTIPATIARMANNMVSQSTQMVGDFLDVADVNDSFVIMAMALGKLSRNCSSAG